MGRKHSKDEILGVALACALDHGLSQLSFGSVAKSLGINDRTIVYYFPTKDELVSDVLVAMASSLEHSLAEAFATPHHDCFSVLRAAWPVLARPEKDPLFALFFEANGLAAKGIEPYRSVVPQLVDAWITRVAGLLRGSAQERRTEAETAIAIIDGLLLLRQLAGPRAANRAAKRLGAQ